MKNFPLIIIILSIFFGVMQPSYAADAAAPVPVGKVVWVKGELQAVMPDKKVRLLRASSAIYLHDTLVTNKSSKAEIVFTDNTLLTFRPNTIFYISQYTFNFRAKSNSSGKFIMNLTEGGFRTITGLIAKTNYNDYKISTPVATIGVRGTDYAVYVHERKMYMVEYQGKPCIYDAQGTLCLDEKTKYGFVPAIDAMPVALKQMPQVLKEKLKIVPAKFS